MKITNRGWFFHLLGLLALVMVSGVMFTGCVAIMVGGGFLPGGTIGSALGHTGVGAIVGAIIVIIAFGISGYMESSNKRNSGGSSSSSSSGSSSSRPSMGSSMSNWVENRQKYPNKCISCTNYLTEGSGAIFLAALSRKSKNLDALTDEITLSFIDVDRSVLEQDVIEFCFVSLSDKIFEPECCFQ